jgi:glycosyltransferase involved in cell wall biosynthesis
MFKYLHKIKDYFLIKQNGLFDEDYYCLQYPDIRRADVNPLWHFVSVGWKEGRKPSVKFDTTFYLESNPDVKPSGSNPLVHYIEFGAKEGRLALPSERYIPPTSESSRTLSVTFEHLDQSQSVNILGKKPTTTPSLEPVVTEIIDKKISIVIPTKNAGADFPFLMKVLRLQEGFREIEVIIVDSGSTDDTVQIAESYDAKVVKIDPSEFSHSYARNLGAENATGDYLLFTVQDALPPSSTWLYELFQVLKNQNVVAVSCAETPREDADLFYRQICWNHYNFLGINDGDRIFSLPKKIDNISLRQNAQLSDLANLISREVFNKYHYRLGYAEDLDLGIRLIKDGYKIAFLGSVRIIHSHNRLPYYFLKRGYVDNQFLSDVFDDFVIPKISMQSFVPDITFTYVFLTRLTARLNNLPKPITPEMFETKVSELFAQRKEDEYPGELSVGTEQYLDKQARQFLEDLISESGFQFSGRKYDGFLTMAFLGYVSITFNYLKNTYETIDESLMTEIKECFYKAFSILVGAHLAYCNKNRTGNEIQDMDKMHKTLMEGV